MRAISRENRKHYLSNVLKQPARPSLHYLTGGRTPEWSENWCPCRGWWGWRCRIESSSSWWCWRWCPGKVPHSRCRTSHSLLPVPGPTVCFTVVLSCYCNTTYTWNHTVITWDVSYMQLNFSLNFELYRALKTILQFLSNQCNVKLSILWSRHTDILTYWHTDMLPAGYPTLLTCRTPTGRCRRLW